MKKQILKTLYFDEGAIYLITVCQEPDKVVRRFYKLIRPIDHDILFAFGENKESIEALLESGVLAPITEQDYNKIINKIKLQRKECDNE